MPPKEDNSAAPAAAAVVEGTGEAPTTNATATASDGRRRDREEPAEEQRVVRPRQEVLEVRKWEWSSHVSDILLHRIDPKIGETKLRDFIREHFREDYPIEQIDNYAMKIVVTNPNRYIPQELREDIEGLEEFQQLCNTRQARQQAMKDADILEQRGVDTLRQWKNTVNRDALNISAFTKGILDNAISEVEQTDNLLRQQEEIRQLKEKLEKVERLLQANVTVLDGLYDSVCNASWNYVVKSRESSEEKFWLEVKKGNFPPSLEWTDEEVDYLTHNVDTKTANRIRKAREKELKEDEENVKPKQERLMMKVLTSPKGWPYGLQRKRSVLDCFVTKEVERAWRVVRDDLLSWTETDRRILVKRRQRVLIGTPGIGKSMGFGSYLLHNLLQYDTNILPVVAYFIGDETYVFDKKEKQVTLYDDVIGLRTVKRLADNYNGYTIYDCSKMEGEPPLGLPESWGNVLISSPDDMNFKGWAKQKTACRFIINCPEEGDIKAMCVWVKGGQHDDLRVYWKEVKNRMSHVGPIPRFIFDEDKSYNDQCAAIDRGLGNIDRDTVIQYYGVGKDGLWQSKKVTHTIVKIIRLVRSNGAEIFVNKPICPELEGKIRGRVSEALKTDAALMAILLPLHELIPRVLETVGVHAFKERNFVDRIHDKLTGFLPENTTRSRKPWVLYENIAACPDGMIPVPKKSAVTTKMELQYNRLYIPSSKIFPVVDAFFFVENPSKTIVGIQVTKSKYHGATTSKVMELREYLAALFVESNSFLTDFTWEIVYVQHKDSEPMTRWQKCEVVVPKCKPRQYNMFKEEHEAIAKHWDEEVYQYHLKISWDDIGGNR